MAATVDELAYIAGFFDGEGSVMVNEQVRRNGSRVSRYARVFVTITQKDRGILEWVQSKVGGTIYLKTDSRRNGNPCYQLAFTHSTVRPLLEAILPYSRVKTHQINLALSLLDSILKYRFKHSFHGQFSKLPDEVLMERIRIKDEIRELNRKGGYNGSRS